MSTAAGFLNLIKPPGMTSHDVVYQVRRKLPRKTKVGHLGTLDPAATGVLPVAVGSATRLIPLLPDLGNIMKAYLAEIELGVSTGTDDLEGEVLDRRETASVSNWGAAEWEAQLAPFLGAIEQIPPQVSAIRQDGQRAYDRVRRGETVQLAARQVQVSRCQFLSWNPRTARLRFFLVCSSGTYVRSIARDLGQTLELGGALAFLVRTQSGPFALQAATTLEQFQTQGLEKLLLAESFPFQELEKADVQLIEKGREVLGEYRPGCRYLARNGLLMGSTESGRAVTEALFSSSGG